MRRERDWLATWPKISDEAIVAEDNSLNRKLRCAVEAHLADLKRCHKAKLQSLNVRKGVPTLPRR